MNIYGPPTIGPALFGTVLQAVSSPVLKERPAQDYYTLCVRYGVDPAFALGWGMAEHRMGTDPKAVVVRYGIRNWGDCRSRRKPTLGGKLVATDRGNFWSYDSWYASLDDALYRITDPAYNYQQAGVRTVAQMAPIAAPPGDFDNRPELWAANVTNYMQAWQAQDKEIGKGAGVAPKIIDLRGELPTSRTGGSGQRNANKRGQILHYSAVNYPRSRDMVDILKSEAAYHIGPYLNERGIAYHFAVDPYLGTIYQLRDEDEVLWHCGYWGTPGNSDGLAIHIPGGSTLRMEPVAVQALAWLLGRNEQRYGFVRGMLKGHREVSDTTCPGPLMEQIVLPYRAGTLRYAGTISKVVITEKEDQVREPAPEQVLAYVNDKGETIIAANLGGQAKRVDGYVIKDMGASVVGTDDALYDRSIQNAAFQPWNKR